MVETGNECLLENYISSHGNRCYESLVHEQVVHVKFIFGLVNNTLLAEHETSTSLVGLCGLGTEHAEHNAYHET